MNNHFDINTIADLLHGFAEAENEKLRDYNISHRPTIGDMYEGLTKELLERTIFKGLNLRIAKGSFIKGSPKEMDIILAEGDGERVPYTNAYQFAPEKVLAVIQVKKTLNAKELKESYENLNEISSLYVDSPVEKYMVKLATDSVHSTLKRSVHDCKNGLLDLNEEYIYHSLVTESQLPVTIVIGYNGLKTEKSVREKFVEYLMGNISTLKNKKTGYGPNNFPALLICEDTSIIKLMGVPFSAPLNKKSEGFWDFTGSSHFNPMYYFLECIWTKLSYKYGLSSDIFGEDLQTPALTPFLSCRAHIEDEKVIGWDFSYKNFDDKALKNNNQVYEWKPFHLDFEQYKLLNALCIEGFIPLSNITSNKEELGKCGYANIKELIESIHSMGVAAIDGDKLILITRALNVLMVGDKFIAGDNDSGRLDNWLMKHSDKIMMQALSKDK